MEKFNATIFYTVDRKHPDLQYMENKSTAIVRTFSDTYLFPTEEKRSVWYGANVEDMKRYIMNDLRLVAGGGYDCKHIHNVRFEITE